MEANQVYTDRQMDQEDTTHTHTHTYVCVCMHTGMYANVKSLRSTSETNIILYINYISINTIKILKNNK